MLKRLLIIAVVLLQFLTTPALSKSGEDWTEYRSRHFRIYYKDAPMDFVKNVEEAAENYYKEITRELGFSQHKGWSFDQRANIYIYADKDDYVNSARQAGWSHGAANAKKKTILTFPAAHGFFDSTLPHELGHIIFREFIGFYAMVPSWLDEGVAMYQEKAKRWGTNKAVKAAIEKEEFISLSELSNIRLYASTDPSVVNLYYAESASIVYFMITEFGQHRFVKFCKKLRDGQTFKQALSETYRRFDGLDELNDSWVKYLNKQ